jgi:hypothetical protein
MLPLLSLTGSELKSARSAWLGEEGKICRNCPEISYLKGFAVICAHFCA